MHKWGIEDTAELALSAIDGVQTDAWQDGNPQHIEVGPFKYLAGPHPSSEQIWGWGVAYELALHGAISCGVPHKPAIWLAILIRLSSVSGNMKFVSIPF